MIRLNNDYNRGAHPEILKMFESANSESYGGYGIDEWCEKAKAEIRKYLECDNAKIHFTVGRNAGQLYRDCRGTKTVPKRDMRGQRTYQRA